LYSDKIQQSHALLRETLKKHYAISYHIWGTSEHPFDERFRAMQELLTLAAQDKYYCNLSGCKLKPWLKYENLVYMLSQFMVLFNGVQYCRRSHHTINELLIVLRCLLDNFVDGATSTNRSAVKAQYEELAARKKTSLRDDLNKLLEVCSHYGDREVCYRITVCLHALDQQSKDSLQQSFTAHSSNADAAGETSAALVSIPIKLGVSKISSVLVTAVSVVDTIEILHRMFGTQEAPNWYTLASELYQALVLRLMAEGKGEIRKKLLSEAQLIFNKTVGILLRSEDAYYLSHILIDALQVVMSETKSIRTKFWCQDCMCLLYSNTTSGKFDRKLTTTSWDAVIQGATEALRLEENCALFEKNQVSFFHPLNTKVKRKRIVKKRSGSAIILRKAQVVSIREPNAVASSSDAGVLAPGITSTMAGSLLNIPSVILHIVNCLTQFSMDNLEVSFPHIHFVEWFITTYLGLSAPEGLVLEFNVPQEKASASMSASSLSKESRSGDSGMTKSRSIGSFVEASSSSAESLKQRVTRQAAHSPSMILQVPDQARNQVLAKSMPSKAVSSSDDKPRERYFRSTRHKSRSPEGRQKISLRDLVDDLSHTPANPQG
jgi:hypothetical protein